MRRRVIVLTILSILLIVLLAVGQFLSQFRPVTPEDAARLLSRSENALRKIAHAAIDSHQSGDFLLGFHSLSFPGSRIHSIDGRSENGVVSFSFDSHHLEGFTALYYCPDGAVPPTLTWWSRESEDWKSISSLNEIPSEGLRVENLGINGQGYLFCVMLRPDWCFIDAYLPT